MKGNGGICWLSMTTRVCSNACHPGLCEILISPMEWNWAHQVMLLVKAGTGAGEWSQPSSKQNWQSVDVQPFLSQPGVGVWQPGLVGTSAWFCHGCRSFSDMASRRHTWAEDENNSFHHLFGLGEEEVVQGLLRDHCTSPLLCLLRSVFFLKFSFL